MPRILVRQPRAFRVNGVRLLPGKAGNEVSAEQLAGMSKNEQFKMWCSLGLVKISMKDAPKPPAPAPVEENIEELVEEPSVLAEEGVPALAIEEPAQVQPAGQEDALKGANVIKAREMIAACESPDLLLEWFDRDERQSVKNAIEKRIRRLEGSMAPEEPEAQEEEQA